MFEIRKCNSNTDCTDNGSAIRTSSVARHACGATLVCLMAFLLPALPLHAQEMAFLDDLKKTLEDVDQTIQKELGLK